MTALAQRFSAYRFVLACLLAILAPLAAFSLDMDGENPSVLPVRNRTNESIANTSSVDDSFSSSLAILVIEQSENGLAGSPVRLSLYAGNSNGNRLQDAPQAVVDVVMAQPSDHPLPGKNSYTLALAGPDSPAVSLDGLPVDNQWFLRGSLRDKSMLRSGLAYQLGRLLFPDSTPEFRFCELLVKDGDTYQYGGIYILAQSYATILANVPDRRADTALLRFSPGQERRGEFVVRAGNKIFTAMQTQPDDAAKLAVRQNTANALGRLDSALHSVVPAEFLRYIDFLDQKSFIDLYILNMLLLNTGEDPVSLYMYVNKDGKFRVLPVWNFEEAVDNKPWREYPLHFEVDVPHIEPPSVLTRRVPVWRILQSGGDIRDLRLYPMYQAMDGANFPWFDRLFLSRSFLTGLYKRYHEVRRGPLSPENLHIELETLAFRLGHALERDWLRWHAEYTATSGPYALRDYVDEENNAHTRQTWSFDQELVKIGHALSGQDAFLRDQLEQLDWMTADLYDRGTSGNKQAVYAFACLGAMMLLMYLLGKRL